MQLQANRAQYGQNGIYLMPTNLYGPGDKFHPAVSHVIPALIKKCVDAKESGADHIEVWGTGSASREFLYVDDAAEGIVLAAERYDGAEPVNLGCEPRDADPGAGRPTSSRRPGSRGEVGWDESKPDGQPRRRVDAGRAADEFGFEARTDVRRGPAPAPSTGTSPTAPRPRSATTEHRRAGAPPDPPATYPAGSLAQCVEEVAAFSNRARSRSARCAGRPGAASRARRSARPMSGRRWTGSSTGSGSNTISDDEPGDLEHELGQLGIVNSSGLPMLTGPTYVESSRARNAADLVVDVAEAAGLAAVAVDR